MNKKTISLKNIAAALLAVPLSAGLAKAVDGDVRLQDCPPAVRQTIEAEAKNKPVEEVERHSIDGREIYVAEIELGQDRDLKIYVAADGSLMKTRRDVSKKALPNTVKKALSGRDGVVDDIEEVTENGKVTYHVEIDRETEGDLNLVVGTDGTIHRETVDARD